MGLEEDKKKGWEQLLDSLYKDVLFRPNQPWYGLILCNTACQQGMLPLFTSCHEENCWDIREQCNIENTIQHGVIDTSKSAWASPVVLSEKKDGSVRFCIDCSKLNECVSPEAYPLHKIEDNLDASEVQKDSALSICKWKCILMIKKTVLSVLILIVQVDCSGSTLLSERWSYCDCSGRELCCTWMM